MEISKSTKKRIRKGVYLVIDPAMGKQELQQKLRLLLPGRLAAVQVWDHYDWSDPRAGELLHEIIGLCRTYDTAILINNYWELLADYPFDGVHFDAIPEDFSLFFSLYGQEKMIGITCHNDLSVPQWASENGIDYISFCSMFPSPSVASCDLVQLTTVKEARKITRLPVFLAGGINPDNMDELETLDYDGIAVVSGIMKADDPLQTLKQYQQKLK